MKLLARGLGPVFKRIANRRAWLRRAYANLKIQQKLFWQQYLLVLIFATVSLAGIQAAFQLYDSLLYSESAKTLNLSRINVEHELKQVEKVSLTIFSHSEIQRLLRKLQKPLTPTERALIGRELTEILWVYVFERDIISVHLVDQKGNLYSGGPALRPAAVGPISRRAAAAEGAVVFSEPLPGEAALICTRQVREIRDFSLRPLGTLIIRINTAGLVRHSTVDGGYFKGNLLIFDGSKRIFASEPVVRGLEQRLLGHDGSGYLIEKVNGRRFFVARSRSSGQGWLYLNVVPYDTIFRPILIMRGLLLLIFAVLLGGAVFVSMKTARMITKPIENLTAQMKRVETGDFTLTDQALPEVDQGDEIGQLQRDFALMIQKINTLIAENYTKQLVIKDAQFRALQAQINPHFLYNTMESINWLAKLNGQHEISRMVEALGNLMRSAMTDREAVISLEREVGLVRDYIAIQQRRFGDRLQFELEIAPEWLPLAIPKLTLQPIVENAIRYGLEKITGVCRIRVTAAAAAGDLEIRVTDNGPGVEPEILRKLAQGESLPGGNGIGLNNIADRLRLMFGEAYGLKLEREPAGGTLVRVRIPGRVDSNG